MPLFNNYEYEKEEMSRAGDDYRSWRYRIKNRKTGNQFVCAVEITKTAFNSKHEIAQIQQAVDSEGESIILGNLSNHREDWILLKVGNEGIKQIPIKSGESKYAKLVKQK